VYVRICESEQLRVFINELKGLAVRGDFGLSEVHGESSWDP